MSFYHIFPFGFCAAPPTHDPWEDEPGRMEKPRLDSVTDDLQRISELGFSGLYLGPIFASGSHGYDTADFFRVDPRLGSDESVRALVSRAHELDMTVILDGVFNHVGREFWAFRDLRESGTESQYVSWFGNVRFDGDNRFGDGFVYDGWEGVEDLVLLNHDNPDVQEHLFCAAEHWITSFGIDGIRLDVAYSLPLWFLEKLKARIEKQERPCWLLGEVIHGDYASFVEPGRLDSITNYECYKGLWSSFNDRNFFEIAHSLGRLFGKGGVLEPALNRGVLPYNFIDNHDVDRIASTLVDPAHIYPLLTLLYALPGVPAIYYGSEYGIPGRKADGDATLRPDRQTVAEFAAASAPATTIASFVRKLNQARHSAPVLTTGAYTEVFLENSALVIGRGTGPGAVLAAVNATGEPRDLAVESSWAGRYRSLLDGSQLEVGDGGPIRLPAYGSELAVRLQ